MKPWPAVSGEQADNAGHSVPGKVKSELQDKYETVRSEVDPAPVEISLADDLLARAHHVLNHQNKKNGVMKAGKMCMSGSDLSDANTRKHGTMVHTDVTTSASKSSQYDYSTDGQRSKETLEINKLVGIGEDPNETRTRLGPKSASVSKDQRKSLSTRAIENTGSATISEKQLDRLRRNHLSSSAKYKPAHQKAPFLTQVNSAKSVSKRVSSRPISAGRGHVKGQLASHRLQDKISQSNGKTNKYSSAGQKPVNISDARTSAYFGQELSTNKDSARGPHSNLNTGMTNQTNAAHYMKGEEAEMDNSPALCCDMEKLSVKEQGMSSQIVTKASSATDNKAPGSGSLFSLLKEGHKLSVPSRLKRLSSTNLKLRLKLQMCSSNPDHKSVWEKSYLSKIEEILRVDIKRNRRQDVADQIVQHTYACQEVLTRLNTLVLSLPNGASSWQQVLAAKRQLENILLKFAQLEDAFYQLCSVPPVIAALHSKSQLPDVSPAKSLTSTVFWLPTELQSGIPVSTSCIKYQSKAYLMKYTELIHRTQLLKLQLHILDRLQEGLLPLLNSFQDDRSSAELFCYVYSLLCTGGCAFPALVADCSAELDDTDIQAEAYDF